MYKVELTKSYFPAQTDLPLVDGTIGDILRERAAKTPDAPALSEIGDDAEVKRSWSWSELLDDCERLAKALATRFDKDERIVIWAPNIPEWILCEFAFSFAGLTLVTANPGFQPRELKYVIEQSKAVALFYVDHFRGNPMGEIARQVASEISSLRETVNMADHDALFAIGDGSPDLPHVGTRDIAQIQYTSGSTGFPKGVLLHHHGISNNARHMMIVGEISEGGASLVIAPLFHTAGCVCTVLGGTIAGKHMHLPQMYDPNLSNAIIEKHGIDTVNGVPTMVLLMLEADKAVPRDLDSIERVGVGGSMVSPELVRATKARFDCEFFTVYGLTETSPILTGTRLGETIEDQTQTVGQPYPHIEISIRDPQTNSVMPLDTVGEICGRGYSIMAGYNDNPDATAEAIDEDGWFHSGDLGTMDSRGYVRITGRVKEMIIRGGENLYPVEIENAIIEHPDVAEVAVAGVPDERMGEIPIAFVRLAEGAELDPNALKAHCRTLLAAQKTPAKWVQVREYPMTGSGKIQKFQLRDNYLAGEYGEV